MASQDVVAAVVVVVVAVFAEEMIPEIVADGRHREDHTEKDPDPALANVFENGLALGLLLLADVSALAPGRPRLLEDSSITDASDPPIRRTAVYVSFRNRAEVARTQNEVERLKISI